MIEANEKVDEQEPRITSRQSSSQKDGVIVPGNYERFGGGLDAVFDNCL